MPLLTVGHGPQDRRALGSRLTAAGVDQVVDVRRFPGSRTNPDVSRESLEQWLPALGVGYRWEERLGGRRRLPPGEPVVDDWWTVAQFAAYAAHTRTPEFTAALDEVLAAAAEATVAVMCSESVWWRCHRRLIADVTALGRGVPVDHLMPDGRTTPHRPSDGAVLTDGLVRWPAQDDQGADRYGSSLTVDREGGPRMIREPDHPARATACAGTCGRSPGRTSP